MALQRALASVRYSLRAVYDVLGAACSRTNYTYIFYIYAGAYSTRHRHPNSGIFDNVFARSKFSRPSERERTNKQT